MECDCGCAAGGLDITFDYMYLHTLVTDNALAREYARKDALVALALQSAGACDVRHVIINASTLLNARIMALVRALPNLKVVTVIGSLFRYPFRTADYEGVYAGWDGLLPHIRVVFHPEADDFTNQQCLHHFFPVTRIEASICPLSHVRLRSANFSSYVDLCYFGSEEDRASLLGVLRFATTVTLKVCLCSLGEAGRDRLVDLVTAAARPAITSINISNVMLVHMTIDEQVELKRELKARLDACLAPRLLRIRMRRALRRWLDAARATFANPRHHKSMRKILRELEEFNAFAIANKRQLN